MDHEHPCAQCMIMRVASLLQHDSAALPLLQFYIMILQCMGLNMLLVVARLFNPGTARKSHSLQFRQVGREHRQVLRPSARPSSDSPESFTQCGVITYN